jgi:hypothetical protein
MRKFTDVPETFKLELTLNEVELDKLFAAVHYWKEDYPELQIVFDKLQESAGAGWAPYDEVEE